MNINNKLMDLLNKSSSKYHAVSEIKNELENHGFKQLFLDKLWKLEKGKYYLSFNDSSIIAFDLRNYNDDSIFKIVASHTDAPNLAIKPKAIKKVDGYNILNTEVYGGLINYTFFDRPLKIAGRVVVKNNNKLEVKLFDSKDGVAIIPSLAIHNNRKVNENATFNRHTQMLPILGLDKDFDFNQYLADGLNVEVKNILDYDLNLKPVEKASYSGVNKEFIVSNQLDNLQSAFTSLFSFIESESSDINVYVSFDNEEVGSLTKAGAFSTILADVLKRISFNFKVSEEEHMVRLIKSTIVSVDNAHANHPNYPSFNDENHKVTLNGGVVIKYNSSQKYTTDSLSGSMIKDLAQKADVKYQTFTNRSDMPGGSTLGAISSSQLSITSVDIGHPQLAMHSAIEVTGSKDSEYMYKLLREYYNSKVTVLNDMIVID